MDGGTFDIAAKVADDHVALHDRLRRLAALAVNDPARDPQGPLSTGLKDLMQAIREHFHREEIWMDAAGLVTHNHAREHDRLMRDLEDRVQAVVDGHIDLPTALRSIEVALTVHERDVDNMAFAMRLSPVGW